MKDRVWQFFIYRFERGGDKKYVPKMITTFEDGGRKMECGRPGPQFFNDLAAFFTPPTNERALAPVSIVGQSVVASTRSTAAKDHDLECEKPSKI